MEETHSKEEDVKFWTQQWGDKAYFNHGTSRAAGVAILLRNFTGQVIYNTADVNGHWLILVVYIDNVKFILTNVYDTITQVITKKMLEDLSSELAHLKVTHSTENILLGGYLNLVNDFLDRSRKESILMVWPKL